MNVIKRQTNNLKNYGFRYEFSLILYKCGIISGRTFLSRVNPEFYPMILSALYFERTGKQLNLNNPSRFTEKIQWSKLYAPSEQKTKLADKYLVRDWVKGLIGEDVLIPLLGVWDNAKEIDASKLPKQLVLKCNHGSHMNIVIRDSDSADWNSIKKQLNKWLKEDYGVLDFETHYLNISKKIIAEELMQEEGADDLPDYKFYCFNGQPHYCQVISNRTSHECIDFFDMEWKHQPFTGLANCENSIKEIKKPITFARMKIYAEKLAQGFSFVRVDFYEINGKLYFGEMTFTPNSGFGNFNPDEWDYKLGKLWDVLPLQKSI